MFKDTLLTRYQVVAEPEEADGGLKQTMVSFLAALSLLAATKMASDGVKTMDLENKVTKNKAWINDSIEDGGELIKDAFDKLGEEVVVQSVHGTGIGFSGGGQKGTKPGYTIAVNDPATKENVRLAFTYRADGSYDGIFLSGDDGALRNKAEQVKKQLDANLKSVQKEASQIAQKKLEK